MAKEQRTFTREFKIEAERSAETSGKPITELARDLGISDSTIHNTNVTRNSRQPSGLILAVHSS